MPSGEYTAIANHDHDADNSEQQRGASSSSHSSPSVARLTSDSDSEEEDLDVHEIGYTGQSIKLEDIAVNAEKGSVQQYEQEEDARGGAEEKEHRVRRRRGTSIQSFELYTPDEEKAVLRKLDRRLVLFMALLYMLSFLDRSNIGNAKIAGLSRDLRLSSSQYEWLLTVFYITYILFEWMTLMYRVVPPHIYISLCVLSWGLLASLQSVTSSFSSLLLIRALLGISEAAFGPGLPFYLSFFYRREELALRTGLFISAAPLATSFASSLAWAITELGQHSPIAPWRLLFLVEGFPSVLVAVAAWYHVPDSPGTARYLTARQKRVAVLRLRSERAGSENEKTFHRSATQGYSSGQTKGLKWKHIVQALLDPKCYLTAFMFFSCNVAFSSMPVFLPTIIHEMGYSSISSQALSAPPYLFSFIIVLLTAYFSDRLRTRSVFICVHALSAAAGYALIATAGAYQLPSAYRYIGIYPAAAGFFSAIMLIITWTLNNQESDEGKGTGVAMLNVIGQCGPLLGTRLYPHRDAPYYVRGMAVCAGFMLLVCVLALVLRLVLGRENERRLSAGRAEREAQMDAEPLVGGARRRRGRGQFLFIL
ncbi:major facilitator superfamily domain-containing protein [Cryomyces antarcticus]